MAPEIRISAALIVRDEEKFLRGCLESLVGHVDEIVVVDTGSQDSTIEIARSFDVKLLERVWRNDFAWARNEGLDAASGNWILYIDADERLKVPAGASLRDNLEGDDVWASRVLFRPRVNSTPYREYRLFRNDPRLRFRRSMHETILPDLERLIKTEGARVTLSPVELTHLGYEAGSEWKHARNLPLLRAALAENPQRLYYWYHLAATLEGLGEIEEALKIGEEGMQLASSKKLGASESAIAALLATRHARLLNARGADPMPTIQEGYRYYPENPPLRLLEARVLMQRGETDAALPILEALAAIDSTTYHDQLLAHDKRVFDVHAPDLLGVALLRLGRRAEAAACFHRAAAAAPDDMSYRIKALAIGGGK